MKRLGLATAILAWATGLGSLAPLAGVGAVFAQTAGGRPAISPSVGPVTAPPAATAPTGISGKPTPGGPRLEPYRFNARERTARALAAWRKGRPEDAVAPLDSALRLEPEDPLVQYNAGTAHLGASQSDAAQLLERAAQNAPPGLAADAFYNLGNARLGAKDAQGAIAAYESALRAQAGLAGAKRNLELALRLLEEQQRQQEQRKKEQDQQQDSGEKQPGEGDPDPKQQGGANGPQNQNPPSQPEQPGEPPEESPAPGDGQPQPDPSQPSAPPEKSPLPQFQNQQDMTAEQAAAILQAVENLERQQRRDQARALARAKTSVEKDW